MDDPIRALNIAQTEEPIAVLRDLIETLEPKGHDVSQHRAMLEAEEDWTSLRKRAMSWVRER
jgi:hypothetical protein